MNTLKAISMADAAAGNEMYLIKNLFPELLNEYKPEGLPLIDAMGNVTLFRRGKSSEKTVAVITHTDEAGFFVRDITDKGFIKFEEVGTIDPRVIISKKVKIGPNSVPGIIGMKAIHLQKREERDSVAATKNLFIDIGAKNKEKALKKVNIGDYITFDTEFGELCKGIIKGKALDRMGVYCLREAISEVPEYDTYYIFTAQKHIGSRGALVALERIRPDFAYIIDAIETADSHGAKPQQANARLGGGAVVGMMDMKGIYDRDLCGDLCLAAKKSNIKTQIMRTVPSATEAGAVRSAYGGTRAAVIGIPCRYTNSPVSLMSLDDLKAVTDLIKAVIGGGYKIEVIKEINRG